MALRRPGERHRVAAGPGPGGTALRTLAVAFAAGALAPVSPCGFALLPAFLASHFAPDHERPGALERLLDGFRVGTLVSAGYAGIFAAAGLAMTVGLRPLLHLAPWAAVVLGVAFVGLGGALALGRQIPIRLAAALPGAGEQAPRAAVAFGAAYAVASLSCTLAVFLAVVGRALATDGVRSMVAVLAAYALGSATLLVALALSAALARGALVRVLRRLLPVVGRLAGVLLAASGVSLLAYWLPVLTGSSRPWSGPAGAAGAAVTGFLEARRDLLAALAALVVATAVTAGYAARRARTDGTGRRRRRAPEAHSAPRSRGDAPRHP